MLDALIAAITTATPAFIASQILAGLALASDLTSFQIKDRRGVLLFLTLSCALLAAHYALLGHLAGALVVTVSGVRFFVARYTQHVAILIACLIASVGATVATMTFWGDVLPLAGGVIATIGAFQSSDLRLRIAMLVVSALFLSYNTLIGSPVGIAVELSLIASNLIGLYRHYVRYKRA